jgi:hypothetical protein
VKSYAVGAAAEEFVVQHKTLAVLAALSLLGGAAAWYWSSHHAPAPEPPPAAAPPAAAAEPEIRNPLPAAAGSSLPALAQSDAPFAAAVTALPGARALADFLRPENLIRHIVVTVDNLPRHKLAVEMRPLEAASGSLVVSGGDQQATLDDRNGARYAALTAIVGGLDMHAVNGLYRQYYPLFQRAYEDLGYPKGYFNDRLVEVIDHLLATPRPAGPLALVRPKVFWEYADAELEALSSGQKLMLRIGPTNRDVIERQLRELRTLIATAPPRR